MRVSDFDYELPPDRIAQEPARRRDDSRLLVLDRASGAVRHRRFPELEHELRPGDLLVLNETKVLPARLIGAKPTGGRVEMLLVEPVATGRWRALLDGSRSLRPGMRLSFPAGLTAVPLEREGDAWQVELLDDPRAAMEAGGEMPLPPYIHRAPGDDRRAMDRQRYQTVFARVPGASAAPTAGLHFTPELLDRLAGRGIATAFVTLHVGLGTFLPVREDQVERHRMHEEAYEIPAATVAAIEACRGRGARVVAVGTTVTRVLESVAAEAEGLRPVSGRTSLFIYPGFRFRSVDALVTNFHLPKSTLLMLVCAFAGREHVLAAYREALREGYRFASYGDAMLVRAA